MGKMADRELDAAMQQAGAAFLARVAANYRATNWRPRPGCEDWAVLDGAAQSLFASYAATHQTPAGMIQAVEAIAHVTALFLYQQRNVDEAKVDFMRRVDSYGREFSEDSSAGRA